jgi:hypothetical protein
LYFSGSLSARRSVKLERFCHCDELKLGSRRQRLGDVAAAESSREAHTGGALSGHERMFAEHSRANQTFGVAEFLPVSLVGPDERRFLVPLSRRTLWIGAAVLIAAAVIVVIAVYSGGGGTGY